MKVFWKIIGVSIITSIVVNGVVNTASRIRRDRLEDANYQEEILKKKEEREAKKAERAAKRNNKNIVEVASKNAEEA